MRCRNRMVGCNVNIFKICGATQFFVTYLNVADNLAAQPHHKVLRLLLSVVG